MSELPELPLLKKMNTREAERKESFNYNIVQELKANVNYMTINKSLTIDFLHLF